MAERYGEAWLDLTDHPLAAERRAGQLTDFAAIQA
jgi:hypothetical protein